MPIDNFHQQCANIVRDLNLADANDIDDILSLSGGVSSDIAVVRVGNKKICIKCALPTLRVSETWEAPIRRNREEYKWLSFVSEFLPQAVPKLYGLSSSGNGFAMAFFEPATHPNWKNELMAGRVDTDFAAKLGSVLGKIHQQSTTMDLDFPNQQDFISLRLEPYLYFTAFKHPDVEKDLLQLGSDLFHSRTALVHGDVSPKNILIGPEGPIFLDAECAVISDPCFDLAFCINHLILKAIIKIADADKLKISILNIWRNYQQHIAWEDANALEARVCRLLPALMLARVDGKSPIEYHNENSPEIIRQVSKELIHSPSSSLTNLLDQIWLEAL